MSDSHAPLLITVAPNGARRGKDDHEALPLTAKEIALTAARCHLAGAGMLHLHVRDEKGAHSLAPALYRDALREVHKMAGGKLLVQVTTESCGIYTVQQQMAAVRSLKVDGASFAIREFFPGTLVDAQVAEFFNWLYGLGVACQFILYAPSEVGTLKSLVARRIIPHPQPHALFVLARRLNSEQSDPRHLDEFLADWPQQWPWSVCAFGPVELAVAERAIALGGHVRVGFENNLYGTDGEPLASNEARVRQVRELAAKAGRPLATVEQVRALFGLRAAAAKVS